MKILVLVVLEIFYTYKHQYQFVEHKEVFKYNKLRLTVDYKKSITGLKTYYPT